MAVKILVVDDDADTRVLLADILQELDYDVLLAASVNEAVRMIQGNSEIGLIILDIMMPERDGFDLLEYLRLNLRFRHIPVVMSSSLSDRDAVIRSTQMGARDYILKPFTVETVAAKVEKTLTISLGTVLLADPDPIARQILDRTLRRFNFHVLTAESAPDALETIEQRTVNLTIADIDLPPLNGFSLLVDVKEIRPYMPVLLITTHNGKVSPQKVIEGGADGVIIKPFRNTQIKRLLTSFMFASGHRASIPTHDEPASEKGG